jgi:polysaccharide deacetylase 2 family uncharacterized protein YibQ
LQVRIGIRESARELAFDSDQSASEIEKQFASAVAAGSGILKLSDSKGVVFLVATNSIAYLEIGASTERRVGFIG